MRWSAEGVATPWPASLLKACRTAIATRWGLDLSNKGDIELCYQLGRAALNADEESPIILARRLIGNRLSERENAALIDCLRVGETYFWRDPRFWAHLRDAFLGPLIKDRRRAGRYQLTVWSAACSSGEEVYSLAILIDSLLPDRERWTLKIYGSDLDAQVLERAREGCYGAWSFRRVDEGWRARYFTASAAQRWQIRPALRADVRFFQCNLAAEPAAGVDPLPSQCDLILCRNVLMYFVPAQARAALCRLRERLSAPGCIVLSAVESVPAQLDDLEVQLWPEALCLSPGAPRMEVDALRVLPASRTPSGSAFFCTQAPTTPPLSLTPRDPIEPVDPIESSEPVLRSVAQESAPGPASESDVVVRLGLDERLAQARRWADRGALGEAQALLQRLLERWPTSADGYRLLAEVQLEQGQHESARRTLARVLYLGPNQVTVHYQYGLLCRRLGRGREATRHLSHALRLLERQGEAEGPSEAFSVGDLRQQLLHQLEGVKREQN